MKLADRISAYLSRNALPASLLVSLFWALCAICVDPAGEFPLNDSWAYSKPVYYLVEQHDLKLVNWPSMSLIAHVLWGYLVSLLFGFSFTTLRISVVFLGAVALCAFICLLRAHPDRNRVYKTVCIFLIATNPLFFSLSYSFMTETPFLAFMTVACCGYYRFMRTGHAKHLALAAFFSAVIVLIRQVGLLVPLAYALSRVVGERQARPSFFYPFIISVIVLSGYDFFLVATDNTYASMGRFSDLFSVFSVFSWPGVLFHRIYFRTGQSILLMGFFLSPLCAMYVADRRGELSAKDIKKRLRVVFAFIPFFIAGFGKVPTGNIIYDLGVGPKTLTDYYIFKLNDFTGANMYLLFAIRAVAVIGAAALVFSCADRTIELVEKYKRNEKQTGMEWFPALAIALYCPFPILFGAYLDRYLLPLIPFFALFLLRPERTSTRRPIKPAVSLACVFIAIMLYFSAASTKDYLNWNRKRWEAVDFLKNRGVACREIDGGFEHSGWYVSENDNFLWGRQRDYQYRVTFGKIDGYSEIASFSYRRLIPPRMETIYVMQKRDSSPEIGRKRVEQTIPGRTGAMSKKGG